jgi:Na+/proline symporter
MMHIELVIAKVVTMVIGLVIAGTAYRGYKRSGEESMLYLAVGFAIISVGAVVEGVFFDVLHFSIFWAGTIQTSIVAAGMLVILYSLYGQSEGYSPDELRRAKDRERGE